MIELRWVHGVYNRERELQYRYRDSGLLPDGFEHDWSEWEQVPYAEEYEKGMATGPSE